MTHHGPVYAPVLQLFKPGSMTMLMPRPRSVVPVMNGFASQSPGWTGTHNPSSYFNRGGTGQGKPFR